MPEVRRNQKEVIRREFLFTPNAVVPAQVRRIVGGVSRQAVSDREARGLLPSFEYEGQKMYRMRDVLTWKRERIKRAAAELAKVSQ